MKRLTAFFFGAAFLVLQPPPAVFADDSDIFGANIQPNVMLLIDNSGSMADSAPSNAFDAPPPVGTAAYYAVLNNCDPSGKKGNITYQPCASVKVYKSGSSSTYTSYANDVASVGGSNDAAARTEASSVPQLSERDLRQRWCLHQAEDADCPGCH